MFYDERIENEKGKICRNAIFIAFVISFMLFGIHLLNLIFNDYNGKYFWFVVLDACVFTGTLLSLLIGFIIYTIHHEDERTEFECNSFYNKAALLLIKCILGVFAVVMPIVFYIGIPNDFATQDFDDILYVLFFIVGIYVVYAFKSNDIYFNYSFMDSEHYYKGVFKNIKKIAVYVVYLLALSAVSIICLIVIKRPDYAFVVKIFLEIGAYYFIAAFEVALLYFLYSFLEKSSYSKENSISKSTVISLGITIFIYIVYATITIFIDYKSISQAIAVQLVYLMSSFDIYIKFALLVFLSYFGYEYQKICNNRLISAACITVLLSETMSVIISRVLNGLIIVFIPEIIGGAYSVGRIFAAINVLVEEASTIADVTGFVIIIFALAKDNLIHKAHCFSVFAFVTFIGIELFYVHRQTLCR